MALPIAPPPEGTPRWRAAEIFLGTYAAIVAVTAVSRVGLSRGNWLVALANVLIILLPLARARVPAWAGPGASSGRRCRWC